MNRLKLKIRIHGVDGSLSTFTQDDPVPPDVPTDAWLAKQEQSDELHSGEKVRVLVTSAGIPT